MGGNSLTGASNLPGDSSSGGGGGLGGSAVLVAHLQTSQLTGGGAVERSWAHPVASARKADKINPAKPKRRANLDGGNRWVIACRISLQPDSRPCWLATGLPRMLNPSVTEKAEFDRHLWIFPKTTLAQPK